METKNTPSVFNWEADKNGIKESLAKNLNDSEFALFFSLGKNLGANPWTREIFAIKYGDKVNIFCGRDFYRRKAQEQSDWNGMISSAVHENDDFYIENGLPKHKFSLKDRGKTVGAYCTIYRKNVEIPFTVWVNFDEYYLGYKDKDGKIKKRYNTYSKTHEDMKPTVWDEKPDTMIEKVAQAQALRGAYQGIFQGTYDESEKWQMDEKDVTPPPPPPPVVTEEKDKKSPQGKPPASGLDEGKKNLDHLEKKIKEAVKTKYPLEELEAVEKEFRSKEQTFQKLGIFDKGIERIKTTRTMLEGGPQ